jgi:RNA polymerase sigma-70 factor, ECF subfamily
VTAVAVRPDEQLYDALRRGDEQAFTVLVERYHAALIRLAMTYVKNRAVAEEVAQETWLAVLRGLDRFESRSLLKTWIFRILTNKAKTRAHRESRTRPFSSFEPVDVGDGGPSVEPERFLDAAHPVWPGHWSAPPRSWNDVPETRLVSKETRAVIDAAIETLPRAQAEVITLRDVAGWSSEEVCEALGISDANQRVLLHRARSKVRAALERYLG